MTIYGKGGNYKFLDTDNHEVRDRTMGKNDLSKQFTIFWFKCLI